MAKFTGVLRKMDGSLGDLTFRQLNGQTVVSEKIIKANNPRTAKQMKHRSQFLNVVAFGQLINEFNHPAFENKPRTMSDINAFVQANLGVVNVYLTKGDKLQGGCVVAQYQVTRGSLPALTIQAGTGDVPVTDIDLTGLTLGPSTTLKVFSQAVVNNNKDFKNGDQISAYVFNQLVNIETQVPYVEMKAFEVTLDVMDDETLLRDVVPADAFSLVDNHLAAAQAVDGGIVWIHSRKNESGKTLVSTQNIYVTNTILPSYQTTSAMYASMESLGYTGKDEPFLTPNVDDILTTD